MGVCTADEDRERFFFLSKRERKLIKYAERRAMNHRDAMVLKKKL